MSEDSQPILVSGAHRTGTTWVGRLLAAAPGLAYISEPLNVLHRPGVFGARVPYWYTYICPDNENAYLPSFRELLEYRYHLGAELGSLRSVRDVLRMGRDLSIFLRGRVRHCIPLLKDPFAVFSLDWFASVLRCRIVVTIRHPAAFASGLKRLGWAFDFNDLLNQPLLMRDRLGAHRAGMQAQKPGDVIGQAGLLWTIIYEALQASLSADPRIQLVRHEDLAGEPVVGFRDLYARLGLEYTPGVERAIHRSSGAGNPSELSRSRTHSVRMDSRASLQNWKRRLSTEEIARVRRITDGVWQHYYAEETWN